MKTAGVALIWFGVVALLKNIGIIQVVDWSIIWPVLLIVAGSSIKFCRYPMGHGMMCNMGVKCGTCKGGAEHTCGGSDCGECKK